MSFAFPKEIIITKSFTLSNAANTEQSIVFNPDDGEKYTAEQFVKKLNETFPDAGFVLEDDQYLTEQSGKRFFIEKIGGSLDGIFTINGELDVSGLTTINGTSIFNDNVVINVNGDIDISGNIESTSNFSLGKILTLYDAINISGGGLNADDGNEEFGYKPILIGNNVNIGSATPSKSSITIGNNSGIGRSEEEGVRSIAIGNSVGFSQQGLGSIGLGYFSAYDKQGDYSLSIGYYDDLSGGQTGQGGNAISLGHNAGYSGQGSSAIAIGHNTGRNNQGDNSIGLGYHSGYSGQNTNSIAIGNKSAYDNQGIQSISIGAYQKDDKDTDDGQINQMTHSISIGRNAGKIDQKNNSIAIGYLAARYKQSNSAISIGNYWDTDSSGQLNQGAYAISLGKDAGKYDQGSSAIAIGYGAGIGSGTVDMDKDSQATQSIAIGSSAGKINQGGTAGYSTAIGFNAGQTNQGSNSVALGTNAGDDTQGANSLALGTNAGYGTQGANSVALGYKSGENTQDVYAIAIGDQAGNSSQGSHSIAIGDQAGKTSQLTYSIAIGDQAGNANQKQKNIAIGNQAGKSAQGKANTGDGGFSIAIGNAAGQTEQNEYSIAIGANAGNDTQFGSAIAIGRDAGKKSQQIGTIAIGDQAGYGTQGTYSIALGAQAGQYSQGWYAIAIGAGAGAGSDIIDGLVGQGNYSIALGSNCGNLKQGSDSVAIGREAGKNNQSSDAISIGNYNSDSGNIGGGQLKQGQYSISIGRNSGSTDQSNNSIAIGNEAGKTSQGSKSVSIGNYYDSSDTSSHGQKNQGISSVSLGDNAGKYWQGNYSIAIGYNSGKGANSGTNAQQKQYSIAIGNEAGMTSQNTQTVALGYKAGKTSQGSKSVSIGAYAGQSNQGSNCIAIGPKAGSENPSGYTNTIILNAQTDISLNSSGSGRFYVKPIRMVDTSNTFLRYNQTNGEIMHHKDLNMPANSKIMFNNAGANAFNSGPNMIKLWSNEQYGFGIDTSTLKYCSGNNHRFYYGGSADSNGTLGMDLSGSNLKVTGKIGVNNITPTYELDIKGISHTGAEGFHSGKILHYYRLNSLTELVLFSKKQSFGNTVTLRSNDYVELKNDSHITSPSLDITGYTAFKENGTYINNINNTTDKRGYTSQRILVKLSAAFYSQDSNVDFFSIQLLNGSSDEVISEIYKVYNATDISSVGFNPIVCDITPYLTESITSIKIKLISNSKEGGNDNVLVKNLTVCVDDSTPWYQFSAKQATFTDKVGIGTTSPLAKLDVSGSIRAAYDTDTTSYFGRAAIGGINEWASFSHLVCNPGNSDYALRQYSNGQTILNASDGQSINFKIDNAEKMILTSGGNFGIGTNNPQQKLEVHGNILLGANGVDSFIHSGRNGAFSADGDLILVADSNSTDGAGGDSQDLIFGYGSDVNMDSDRSTSFPGSFPRVETMRIKSSNSCVGIGTNEPGAKLDVSGDIRAGYDTDTTSYFGKAAIGYCGHSDWASFAHLNLVSAGNFALMQNNDGQTILNASTGFPIQFKIGNDEKMILDTDGNFGIGLSNPGAKLDVRGSIRAGYDTDTTSYFGKAAIGYNGESDTAIFSHIDNNTNLNYALKQLYDGTTSINAPSNKVIKFKINNDEKMILDKNGNFGIGTTSPLAKLDVSGSINITGSGMLKMDGVELIQNHNNSDTPDLRYNCRVIGSTTKDDGMYINFGSTGDVNAHCRFYANGMTQRMMIKADSGNVGIGTTSPLANLDVSGSIKASGNIGIGGAAPHSTIKLVIGDHDTGISQAGDGKLTFYTNGTERMRIVEGGNVGIGTDDPQSKLDVNGGVAIGATYSGTTTAPLNGMIVQGNVGIGLSNPGAKLDVSGDIRAAYNTDTTSYFGKAAIGGHPIHNNWASFSHLNLVSAGNFALMQNNDGQTILNASTGYPIQFKINNDEKMKLDKDGNVGIGTTSPSAKLEVDGDTTLKDVMITNDKTIYFQQADNKTYGMQITSDTITGQLHTSLALVSRPNDNYEGIIFKTNDDIRMFLSRDGRLGIGTGAIGTRPNVPLVQLEISGTDAIKIPVGTTGQRPSTSLTGSSHYGYIRYNTTNSSYEGFGSGNAWGSLGGVINVAQNTKIIASSPNADSSNNQLQFFTATAGSTTTADATERMRIDANGNVGIGTTNPSQLLHIYGKEKNIVLQTSNNGQDDNNSILFQNSGGNFSWRIGRRYNSSIADNNSNFVISGGGSGNSDYKSLIDMFTINYDGNVGIGTTSPTAKLDVSGDAFVHTNSDASLYVGAGGDGTITGSTNYLRIHSTSNSTNPNATDKHNYIDYKKNSLNFRSSTTTRMTITEGGNVGIGLSSPLAKLDVSGSIRASGNIGIGGAAPHSTIQLAIGDSNTGITNNGVLVPELLFTSDSYSIMRMVGYSEGSKFVNIYGSLEVEGYVKINNSTTISGNVGIGTITPQTELHVNGDARGVRIGNYTDGVTSVSDETQKLEIIGGNLVLTKCEVFATDGLASEGQKISFHRGSSDAQLAKPDCEIVSYNYGNSSSGYAGGIGIFTRQNNTSNERLRIDLVGNVGIGTVSPTAKLDVSGSIRAAYDTNTTSYFGKAAIGGAGTSLASFSHIDRNTTTDYALRQDNSGTTLLNASDGQSINFKIGNDEKMVLTPDGKFGIGLSNPGAKFDVSGSIRAAYDTDTTSYFGRAAIGGSSWNSSWASFSHIHRSGDNDYALRQDSSGTTLLNASADKSINFKINNGEKMRLDKDGNVGIGTNNPQQKLEVHGNILLGANGANSFIHSGAHGAFSADGELRLVADSNSTTGAGGSDLIFGYGSSVDMNGVRNTPFPDDFPRVETMRIKSSNSCVGIGKEPQQKLDVNGTAQATSFNATSDVRHKENICDLDRALEKICAIRGVNYTFKTDKDKNMHAGILAQEVADIIPEAICKTDDDMWSANYNTLIGYLIESVKTLKAENDAKDAQITILKTSGHNLENTVTHLNNTIENMTNDISAIKAVLNM